MGGKNVDIEQFKMVQQNGDKDGLESWLKQEKWYGTTGDMEHLFQFWTHNFGHKPDFRPNYIVPNLQSIVRCLSGGSGLAVMPDFLCKHEIADGRVQLIWEGDRKLENTLYFATRKKSRYQQEINHLKTLFYKLME